MERYARGDARTFSALFERCGRRPFALSSLPLSVQAAGMGASTGPSPSDLRRGAGPHCAEPRAARGWRALRAGGREVPQ
jgi:hypothetical protein